MVEQSLPVLRDSRLAFGGRGVSGGGTDLSVEEQSEEEEEDESDFAHKELGGLEELGSILSGGFGARDPWAEIALSG